MVSQPKRERDFTSQRDFRAADVSRTRLHKKKSKPCNFTASPVFPARETNIKKLVFQKWTYHIVYSIYK